MSAPVLNPESGSPTRATAVPARSTRKATAQQTGRIGVTCSLLTTHVLRQDLPGTPSGWDSDLLCDDTAGAGGGPLRSESARRLTPEIRQSKFPGTPRPSVTLALAAPGPPVQLRWTTLRVQGP